ncbi:hypothetical protein AB0G15_12690 [Streptosporangium sp. NPDC023825]|uniref:hypothetical protein n=1 Tax=Streptosporangium sp. NPDC023825 TaxID=3154909 RepID=UPI003429BD6F
MDNCRAVPPAVDEATVESHDKALAVVQRLLTERGIRAHRHHTISLGLFANSAAAWPDQPPLRSWMERHPPELTVKGSHGCRVATVTMGVRSGSYLVSLCDDSGPRAVRSEHPEQVVALILAARRT